MDKEKTLEESFFELNNMVKRLEEPDITLEESFTLYNKGMMLIKECNNAIKKIEQKLIVLEEES